VSIGSVRLVRNAHAEQQMITGARRPGDVRLPGPEGPGTVGEGPGTVAEAPAPPNRGYFGQVFSPDGTSIYSGVLEEHGLSASTSIVRLSFGGKVLERFATRPAGTIDAPDEFDTLSIAPNGDAWAIRTKNGLLYRFHVAG
jgi:hypothetical protein